MTSDVRKDSHNFGRVIDIDSVDGHHEARHGGFIDDGRQYWVPGLGWQSNMVSGSAVGQRLYYTSSPLANWDKGGDDNEQFLKAYEWDGKELTKRFGIDFLKERLGRPHLINFGSTSLYGD